MRIVVKVGTSTLASPTGRLNIRHAEELVKVLSDLKNEGHEVILVSSGAIGMGVGKLSLPARPKDTTTKQACAAVGQCELMYTYDRLFSAYDHTVAQILLTGVDVEHTERRVNIQNPLTRLLELGALPIINENDSVATDEITSIGDNDTLAAIVACCCKADLLVRSARMNRSGSSMASIIWGFTARKIRSQSPATSALVAVWQPSSAASASAFAAVRFARNTFSGSVALHTARAIAPPMFPQPKNPMVFIIIITLPRQVCTA